MNAIKRLSLAVTMSAFLATPNADCAKTIKHPASDDAYNAVFGHNVAFGGDTIVSGSPRDDDHGSNSGSVYEYERSLNTWLQQVKLTAIDAESEDFFGRSVAIHGDNLVVGAPTDRINPGSVYVFA